MKKLSLCLLVGLLVSMSVQANVTVFENDAAGWNAATVVKGTINWDDVAVADSGYQVISGSHYSSLAGSPQLSIDSSSGLYIVNPGSGLLGGDFIPVSGENVFSPDADPPASPEGNLTITFNQTMNSIGVWFLDVEEDYANTGIKIGDTLYSFSGSQGDDSQSFLGIVSSTGFTTAEIYISYPDHINGVGIDDLSYGVVPAPGAVLLASMGVSMVGWLRRRKQL